MANLVQGFLVLRYDIGVGYQAATAPEVEPLAVRHGGAYGDGGVHLATYVDIAQATAVRPSAAGFEFFNDLHGAHLGCAGDRAAGKGGGEQVKRALTLGELAAHHTDQVMYIGIAFQLA